VGSSDNWHELTNLVPDMDHTGVGWETWPVEREALRNGRSVEDR